MSVFLSEIGNTDSYHIIDNDYLAVADKGAANQNVHIFARRAGKSDHAAVLDLEDLFEGHQAAINLYFHIHVEVGKSVRDFRGNQRGAGASHDR